MVKIKNNFIFASEITKGRVAQLVQSTWFTPKGSGVRIPSRPPPLTSTLVEVFFGKDFTMEIVNVGKDTINASIFFIRIRKSQRFKVIFAIFPTKITALTL